jgi:FkbM family methyltransferase
VNRLQKKIGELARLACWKFLTPTIRLTSGVSVPVQSQSDWVIMNEVMVNGNYDTAIGQAFSSGKDGRQVRVVDLGANVGFFSLRCIHFYIAQQKRFPLQLFAVEGSPVLLPDLERRLLSPVAGIKINLRCGLVGRRFGEGMIYSSVFNSSVSAVVKSGGKVSRNPLLNRRAYVSQYIDLEELVGPEPVDLLKCDIEGSELEFLRNYPDLLRRTRSLVIEFHPNKCDEKQCRMLLDSYSFRHVNTIEDDPEYSLETFAA